MRFIVPLIGLIVLAVAWFGLRGNQAPVPVAKTDPTDTVLIGTITLNSPGHEKGVPYLVYEKPGAPALSQKLILDEYSVCAASNGATPCIAMNVTLDVPFNGKRALVEGNQTPDGILVRKMRVAMEGEELRSYDPGDVFVAWTEAIELIRACAITSIMQSHALDVYLTLKSGEKVRAVEPVIDEMFRFLNESNCRGISVATE